MQPEQQPQGEAWWARFENLLDDQTEWPTDYLFKFIVPKEELPSLQDTIGEEDVKKVIGRYREYTVFELKDAIMARDLEKSLFIGEQMRQAIESDPGEFFKLIGFFYSVFSNIWQILRLQEQNKGKKTIRSELGINPYYFNNLWDDAAHFKLADMPRIFEALLDADISAKGYSTLDIGGILMFLIERMVGKKAA